MAPETVEKGLRRRSLLDTGLKPGVHEMPHAGKRTSTNFHTRLTVKAQRA